VRKTPPTDQPRVSPIAQPTVDGVEV